jgi:hypothetical protein
MSQLLAQYSTQELKQALHSAAQRTKVSQAVFLRAGATHAYVLDHVSGTLGRAQQYSAGQLHVAHHACKRY